MIIPEKIKAGGITYTIKQDNAPINKETNTWGITRHDDQIIYLDPNMSQERQCEVMLHELMHVALCTTGLSSMFDSRKELSEEDVVNGMARALFTIIKDNKLDFRS